MAVAAVDRAHALSYVMSPLQGYLSIISITSSGVNTGISDLMKSRGLRVTITSQAYLL